MVGGREYRRVMKLEEQYDAEQYYTTSIGPFNYKDEVKYYFAVKGNEETISPVYSFSVLKWRPAGRLIGAAQEEDHMVLQFDGLEEYSKYLYLEIDVRDRTLKFNFSSGTEYVSGLKCEPCNYITGVFELKADMKSQTLLICNKIDGDRWEIDINKFVELQCDSRGIIHRLRYNFKINNDEKFFGMGERFEIIQYRGKSIDNYVYNQYRGQGLKTYMPVPFAISSGGYGLYLDSACYSIFKFGSEIEDMLEIEVDMEEGNESSCLYMFCGSPKYAISKYMMLTGKPAMVPKWSLGPWMSSNNWDSQSEVLSQAELTCKYNIPATVLVIEQWSDEATFYIFNDARYNVKNNGEAFSYGDFRFEKWGRWPDPKAMVKALHDKGIRVLLWQAPVTKYMDGISHAQRDQDEKIMLELGYNVKKSDGSPYRIPYYEWFKGSLVPDFTNRDAVLWWMKKREYLIDEVGIDGFKTDGGECIYGDDTVFSNGKTGREMRNLYPSLYISTYNSFANSHTNGDCITFSRAGYAGSQLIPMHWAGDERSTFEAFRSSINAGLSSGMSGIIFWGWDIGGFSGDIPSAELYIRASQMAVFCPVMQYHAETKGEYNRDRTPWNIAERTNCPKVIDIFRKCANLRMNILPYIYNEAKKSVQVGVPLMRSMFLEYPQDVRCINESSQYFFGEDLLVAPVIYEGETTRQVYFPKGSWCNLFTGEEIYGEKSIFVNAQLDEIPVFIKEDSIIPLNLGDTIELCSYVGNSVTSYKRLTFLLYIKSMKYMEFADDCGNQVNIRAEIVNESVNIKINGNYKDEIHLILRGIGNIDEITINGSMYECAGRNNEVIVSYCLPEAVPYYTNREEI